ncbi:MULTISPECIES: DUF4249 domain-containing protein [Sphingobacterium]|uniref:DUF4249 domain-containing protein n=1 Tax=Sphingobacterium anhuiense TaxID=493780 RepID=A0ABW5YSX0_9SPHI|nr:MULTISPECIES: DUF4249 domain-containing protein [Sphingobacterium]MCW2260449.1 hypothetical protein [Sphingobacterium kitahiroshimense]TCR05317.1 uncharacterized protein DUF4249 [Sphingobacterium sp. JUb20]TCR05521.1 uncharacterized protein DUF4249 [Sphingobacterium sp. JUb78]
MNIKTVFNCIVLVTAVFLSSCEDKIDLELDAVVGKYVIVGDLHNANVSQTISINRVVDFSNTSPNDPVLGAYVQVTNMSSGRSYQFADRNNGSYVIDRMTFKEGDRYALSVTMSDGSHFESTCIMPKYVAVDSIGLVRKKRFNDEYIYASFGFNDPANQDNYYKYKLKLNDEEFKFSDVFSDKFNDGLFVEHEISNEDEDIKVGDEIQVLRQCIAKDVYTYWSNVKGLNPGSAAPSNPISNISNGALGYFSVSSAQYYELKVLEKANHNTSNR